MNLHFYRDLLMSLSQCARLPDPHRLLDTGQLHVDGCDLVLAYHERIDPNRVLIRIDLGPPPEHHRAQLWRVLLMANDAWAAGGTCVFSLHPSQERILMTVQQAITHDLTGKLLADGLLQAVRQAKESWADLVARLGDDKPPRKAMSIRKR